MNRSSVATAFFAVAALTFAQPAPLHADENALPMDQIIVWSDMGLTEDQSIAVERIRAHSKSQMAPLLQALDAAPTRFQKMQVAREIKSLSMSTRMEVAALLSPGQLILFDQVTAEIEQQVRDAVTGKGSE